MKKVAGLLLVLVVSVLVSVAVSFSLLLVAGVRPRILGGLALAAVLGTTLLLTSGALKDYQVARFTTYLGQDQAVSSDLEGAALEVMSRGET